MTMAAEEEEERLLKEEGNNGKKQKGIGAAIATVILVGELAGGGMLALPSTLLGTGEN